MAKVLKGTHKDPKTKILSKWSKELQKITKDPFYEVLCENIRINGILTPLKLCTDNSTVRDGHLRHMAILDLKCESTSDIIAQYIDGFSNNNEPIGILLTSPSYMPIRRKKF